MKNMIMKNAMEDFLQNYGYVLDEDGLWTKEYAKIYIDFVDEEGILCKTFFNGECCEVTNTHFIVYDHLNPYNSDCWIKSFDVELKNIKGARIKIEAGE